MAKARTGEPSLGGLVMESGDGEPVIGNVDLAGGDQRSDSTVDASAAQIAGIASVDPGSLGSGGSGSAGDGASQPRRGRGRPRGTGGGSKPTQKSTETSVAGIEKLLFSLHQFAAAAIKAPEFALEKEEAKLLAESIGNVAQHYAVEVNPKVLAWAGLAGAIGTIYGPRIALMRMQAKRKGKRGENEQGERGNVTPISGFDPQNFGMN